MNKFICMGRVVADPEIRYTQTTGKALARFRFAVNRTFKRQGEPDADFFNCTAFGKTAEFFEKYTERGTKLLLEGEMRNNDYVNRDGVKVSSNQFLVSHAEFCESKGAAKLEEPKEDFMDIPDGIEEELPFA